MIHLNLRPDLETALRKMSADSGYSLTTICVALMHLGLTTGAKRIDAACVQHSRPMGRPVENVPALETPTEDKQKQNRREIYEQYRKGVKS